MHHLMETRSLLGNRNRTFCIRSFQGRGQDTDTRVDMAEAPTEMISYHTSIASPLPPHRLPLYHLTTLTLPFARTKQSLRSVSNNMSSTPCCHDFTPCKTLCLGFHHKHRVLLDQHVAYQYRSNRTNPELGKPPQASMQRRKPCHSVRCMAMHEQSTISMDLRFCRSHDYLHY